MKRNLACARVEAATQWLAGYDPGDGHGPIADQARNPAGLFTQLVVIAAFIAGADHADSDFAIERSTGQRQLDDAHALMAESVALFRGYADHHAARADEARRVGNVHAEGASMKKATVNMLAALRLREWMAGKDSYSVSVPLPIPAEIAANGDIVPVDIGMASFAITTVAMGGESHWVFGTDLNVTITATATCSALQSSGVVNVRPVTEGPLADPGVVERLIAVGEPTRVAPSLSLAGVATFRLQTADPRFKPGEPVLINGYPYQPTKEA